MLGLLKSLSICFPSVLAGFEQEKHNHQKETAASDYKHRGGVHIILVRKSLQINALSPK